MLMKVKTIEIPKDFERRPNGITLTKEGINQLNNRIRKEVQENQEAYLHDLDNTKFQKNKSKDREL